MSLMFDSLSCSLFSLPHASPTPPACTPCPQHAAPPLLAPRLFHIHGPPETSFCPMVPSSHGDPVASDHAWLELRACGREGAAACGWPCFLLPPAPGKVGRDMEAWVGLEWKQRYRDDLVSLLVFIECLWLWWLCLRFL